MNNPLVDERLLKHLTESKHIHGRVIIGFDFDDTVSPLRESHWSLAPVRTALKNAKDAGHFLICVTNNTDEDHVRKFCKEHGFEPDLINQNFVEEFKSHSKIYCNIYLDDKAALMATTATLNKFLSK